MRTTLKRGVGRGAALTGAARPAGGPLRAGRDLPAAGRRRGAAARSSCGSSAGRRSCSPCSSGGTAGGAYLYLHETVAAVAPQVGRGEEGAQVAQGRAARPAGDGARDRLRPAEGGRRRRAVPLRHADARPGRPRRARRSRCSPSRATCGRDPLPGQGRRTSTRSTPPTRRAARAGTLETVRKLTGVPINYIITVNFRGFRQLVDKLGGIWMDIDRRYFNDRGGSCTGCYAKINLQPGYQRLNGLAGARLRPLPAHRLRPLPQRAPAALRPGVQGSDRGELLAPQAAAGDQGR